MSAIIDIQNISVAYKGQVRSIISNLNLSIESGKLYALLGENGCGKSTLIRVIAGLQGIESGKLKIAGKSIQSYHSKELAKKLSVVLTEQSFQGLVNVKDYIAFGRYPFTGWLGKRSESDNAMIEKSIQRFELADLKEALIGELSDGQRQRVQLARAYAQETDILLLDEPSTHLDIKNTRAVFKLMQMLTKEEGKSLIFSSHQLDLAIEHADHLIIHTKNGFRIYKPEEYKQDKTLIAHLTGE